IRQRSFHANQLSIWWLGQSGFLVQWQGRQLLMDPYLSDSLTHKYAATDKPHVRMTARAIDPRRLASVAVTTSSHNHTDHLDAETLLPLKRVNPELRILVPAANVDFAATRLGLSTSELIGIDAGESCELAGFTFHALPAAHEDVERDEQGRCKFLGFVVQCGPYTLYHSGDTVLYDQQVELLRNWSIDVALLPINGRAPERRVAGNLWGREAAQLAHDIGARLVIPCHYEMFEFNTATTVEFEESCRKLQQPYKVLRCGEGLSW
ncbi:MAG: MBL fold metallo-hydrolase, partial [Planctomycetales bacterium]|nr:MBL fold metallo-hydrolase [Planctomycetales bacterium]